MKKQNDETAQLVLKISREIRPLDRVCSRIALCRRLSACGGCGSPPAAQANHSPLSGCAATAATRYEACAGLVRPRALIG
jgi:hypothetical protein